MMASFEALPDIVLTWMGVQRRSCRVGPEPSALPGFLS